MTEKQLAEIKERIAKATEGPWYYNALYGYLAPTVPQRNIAVICNEITREYNADFIAHARQDIPELVAEVERLREALDNAAGYISIGESAKENDFICRALGVDINHYGIYGEDDEE